MPTVIAGMMVLLPMLLLITQATCYLRTLRRD